MPSSPLSLYIIQALGLMSYLSIFLGRYCSKDSIYRETSDKGHFLLKTQYKKPLY